MSDGIEQQQPRATLPFIRRGKARGNSAFEITATIRRALDCAGRCAAAGPRRDSRGAAVAVCVGARAGSTDHRSSAPPDRRRATRKADTMELKDGMMEQQPNPVVYSGAQVRECLPAPSSIHASGLGTSSQP